MQEIWDSAESPLNSCWRGMGRVMLLEMVAQSLKAADRGETVKFVLFPQ